MYLSRYRNKEQNKLAKMITICIYNYTRKHSTTPTHVKSNEQAVRAVV